MHRKTRLDLHNNRRLLEYGSFGIVLGIALLSLVRCTFVEKALDIPQQGQAAYQAPSAQQPAISSLASATRVYLPFIKNDKPMFLPWVPNVLPTPTPTPTPTATPRPAGEPPPYSTSFYMSTTDYDYHYQLGQTVGQSVSSAQDLIIFLDYGQPWYENGAYGTAIFGSLDFRSTSQIIDAVKGFCRGYYLRAPSTSHLTLAIGTSNYGSTHVTREHGAAWAQMVKTLNDWIASPPTWADRIKIAGAIDAEPGWNGAPVTRAWVDGYDSAASGSVYYNFGSCDSCPFAGCETCTPSRGWTYEDLWYISWGVRSAFTVPEIYLVGGENADQWYRVSLYGYSVHGQAIRFAGVMTQYQSCQQRGCTTNTPPQGWRQLYDKVNSNPATALDIKWLTDIKW
ncbi:MAG: hypothetical protein LLG44_05495 [Chloroflexi bacterium]|nr:hypothetical protein [Chloroflexota bacterium]